MRTTEKTISIGSDLTVEMGYQTVILNKLYGATIFCDLKICPSSKTGDWIISRQARDSNNNIYWEEVCRIDGQESLYRIPND